MLVFIIAKAIILCLITTSVAVTVTLSEIIWNASLMRQVILLMYSLLDKFRVNTPIIRRIKCWFSAYGFLHRVFGWMVVLRAAAYVVYAVRNLPCDHQQPKNSVQKIISCNSKSNAPDDWRMYPKYIELRMH